MLNGLSFDDFALAASGSLAASFASSLVMLLTGLAAVSPLLSSIGGAGGGGGGMDIPFGAVEAGASTTWAAYEKEKESSH